MPRTLSGGDIKITENIIEKSHQKECRICYFTSSMERGVVDKNSVITWCG